MAEIILPATFLLPDINPEPWTAPMVGKGYAHKRPKLRAYQEAIKSLWDERHPGLEPVAKGTPLELTFLFSRSTQEGKPADATNLAKALEDALQGKLYVNDRDNKRVISTVMEQGPRVERVGIVIAVRPFELTAMERDLYTRHWGVYEDLKTKDVPPIWRPDYNPNDDF